MSKCSVIHCTIDGGISFNPGGESYGSFQVEEMEIERRTFGKGNGHTNNTAEVEIALAALYWIAENIPQTGIACASIVVRFHSDSQLTCNWINRGNNPRTGQVHRLVALLTKFRAQARAFAGVEMQWHPREISVAVLGH